MIEFLKQPVGKVVSVCLFIVAILLSVEFYKQRVDIVRDQLIVSEISAMSYEQLEALSDDELVLMLTVYERVHPSTKDKLVGDMLIRASNDRIHKKLAK